MNLCSTYISIIPELGEGWLPAVPKSEVELNNVKRSHKGLGHTTLFWIGGSTNYQPMSGHFLYEGYHTDDSGEWKMNRSKTIHI